MEGHLISGAFGVQAGIPTPRIYTRSGDTGETSLHGGQRVSKASPRVAAYGEVDELNSVIGWARSQNRSKRITAVLHSLQNDLFMLGADLATPFEAMTPAPIARTTPQHVARLERIIDDVQTELKPSRRFILPAGGAGAAALHVARAVCRRAERQVVALAKQERINEHALVYLNRLSDLLFVLARLASKLSRSREVQWKP